MVGTLKLKLMVGHILCFLDGRWFARLHTAEEDSTSIKGSDNFSNRDHKLVNTDYWPVEELCEKR